MSRWITRMTSLIVVLGSLGGPARAEPPTTCPISQDQRDEIRDHNTKAKQELEEEKYLLAALQWLLAQSILPSVAGCTDQRSTRVDLALRALGTYNDALKYDPADATPLGEVLQHLDVYTASLPEGERRAAIVALTAELTCVRTALPNSEAALLCSAAGRALQPKPVEPVEPVEPVAPVEPPVTAAERPPEPTPAPKPDVADPKHAGRRRGLAIGLGVSLGLGVGALAAGVGTWALARTGGPQHLRIRDAATASLADGDPSNDIPPNLPADQDYCTLARAGGPKNPTIADLCDRHDRTSSASIATFALSGVFAAASLTLAVLLARSPRTKGHAARTWRIDLTPTRGGMTIAGALRF